MSKAMKAQMSAETALAELQNLFEFQKERLFSSAAATQFTSAGTSVTADVTALREILVDYIDLKNQVDAIDNLNKATEDLKRMGQSLSFGETGYDDEPGPTNQIEQLL